MPATAENQLELLHNLASLVDEARDLPATLEKALALMTEKMGMMRGAITMIDPATGRIRIEASVGLNRAQQGRGTYLPGEGITGTVIVTGKPMCIADVSREPLFLNKTRCRDLRRDSISFLCVPIKLKGQTVGALSVDRLRCAGADLAGELALLQVAAALLGHTAYESRNFGEDATGARPAGFVGNSGIMRQVYEQIAIVAPAMTTVFLHGESGTGKELAARAIHNASPRASGPFVPLNCAALPENLIESELFGHERGAFTGAIQTRRGRFELASGGTLFLDEVGELSPLVQAKLLRVLQEHAFERVGGMESLPADARVIAATNRDLAQMTETGAFRRDLYYRLNVFPISLPPLRARKDDILPLAAHFLRRFAGEAGRQAPGLSLAAMDMLQKYDWPGNIRELENVMERATLLAAGEHMLLPRHLPEALRPGLELSQSAGNGSLNGGASLEAMLGEVEAACIATALRDAGGSQTRAAARLGITPRILGLRLKKYGMDPADFRQQGQCGK